MATAATENLVPPSYGYLEYLAEQDGNLLLSGWMLMLDGAFDSFVVRALAHGIDLPVKTVERKDLPQVIAHVPHADRGGFLAAIPLHSLPATDTVELTVLGLRGGRPVGRMNVGVHRTSTVQPYPPSAMMKRATGNDGHAFWFATGVKAANDFRRALAPHVDLQGIKSLLEWGCGSGRLTRHLIDRFPAARVHGTDIDREAVQWAGANLAGSFVPCSTEPPLPFADRQFDAIVALSVFTHLTRKHQELWLAELRRVVQDQGIVAFTTHGEFAARWVFHQPGEYEQHMRQGFFDGLADENLGHVASGAYYRSTFQTRQYTESAWSKWFRIVDYVEAGVNNFQDIVVMRPR